MAGFNIEAELHGWRLSYYQVSGEMMKQDVSYRYKIFLIFLVDILFSAWLFISKWVA